MKRALLPLQAIAWHCIAFQAVHRIIWLRTRAGCPVAGQKVSKFTVGLTAGYYRRLRPWGAGGDQRARRRTSGWAVFAPARSGLAAVLDRGPCYLTSAAWTAYSKELPHHVEYASTGSTPIAVLGDQIGNLILRHAVAGHRFHRLALLLCRLERLRRAALRTIDDHRLTGLLLGPGGDGNVVATTASKFS